MQPPTAGQNAVVVEISCSAVQVWIFLIQRDPSSQPTIFPKFDLWPTSYFPFYPTLEPTPLLTYITDLKSRQQIEALLFLLGSSRLLQLPYLESNTFAHNSPWWWKRFHCHFPSKALLNFAKPRTPKPPFSFGRQTVSHFTQAIFCWSEFLPHKNHRCNLSSLSCFFLWISIWWLHYVLLFLLVYYVWLFCRMGLRRHLTAAEIVEQAVFARRLLTDEVGSITNVVFMVGLQLHW